MGSWESILDRLRDHFREEQFNIWFKSMDCKRLDEDLIELEVPNEHYRDWIAIHFVKDISRAIADTLGSPRSVILSVKRDSDLLSQGELPLVSDKEESKPTPPSLRRKNGKGSAPSSLTNGHQARINPEYTFEDFVVGPSNQFAHAAALAVAERPAESYNPLFIYGGVGLGKTHLMHAIGGAVQRANGRVAYVTSEQFMNELISSIERKEMSAFRERYRTQCDVLLIDDIQFIAGKERTQEEFFHTFNALYNNHKQIILTSDKTPQEIPGLEERLQSRFSWGLIADIQRPEMETRVAILKKKAAREGINLPDQVGVYLANHIDSNIRELEGHLKRIAARADLSGKEFNVDLAKQVMEPFIKQRAASLTPERILKLVAGYFNVKVSELKGRGRARAIAYPRQLAMFLSRKHTGQSYPALGRAFQKDHTTVINAYQKIENLLLNDASVKGDIEALERNLLS